MYAWVHANMRVCMSVFACPSKLYKIRIALRAPEVVTKVLLGGQQRRQPRERAEAVACGDGEDGQSDESWRRYAGRVSCDLRTEGGDALALVAGTE